MDHEHETMCASVEDETAHEIRTRRGNYMGSLRLRGRTYWARWHYKGQSYERSTGVKIDERKAEAKAIKKMEEFTAPYRLANERDLATFLSVKVKTLGEAVVEANMRGSALTLGEAFAAFKNSPRRRKVSAKRLEVYEKILAELVVRFGSDTLMNSVTEAAAEGYAAELGERYSNLTHNNYITSIAHVWDVLASKNHSRINPWKGIRMKEDDSVAREPLTDGEIDTLLKTAGDGRHGELRTMLVVGANTGLRLGDCAMLKWENIDFDAGFIRVKTIKTGANVSIPLLGELREELESRKSSMSANGYVMPSMANSYATSPKSATDAMSQVFRKSGVGETVKPSETARGRPRKSFHSLRTTFVTRCAEADISLEIVKSIVGHSSVSMTNHYTHIREKAVKEAFEKAGVK